MAQENAKQSKKSNDSQILSADFLQRILRESVNEIYVFEEDTWRFVYVNDAARLNLGFSEGELAQMTPLDIKPDLTEEMFREILSPLYNGLKKKTVFETVHLRKNKSKYPVEVHLQMMQSGAKRFFVALILDITERKLAEEALRKSEKRFRTALYSIGDAVITTDTEGNIIHMNPVAEKLTGYEEPEARGKALNEVFVIVNELTGLTAENPVNRVLKEGNVIGLANHTVLISKDGQQIPVADSGAPILDEDGKTTGVVLVFRDQSIERKWQREISENEARFRGLFESSAAGIALHRIVYDAEGNPVDYEILDVNPQYEKITGIPKEKAVGQRATLLYGTDQPPYFEQYLSVALSGNSLSFETYFEPMQKHFYITVFSPEREKFATTFIDITPLKNAIRQIEKSSRQFSKMFYEHSAVKMILEAETGRILDVNHAAEKFYGWTGEQMRTMKIKDINTLSPEEIQLEIEKVRTGKQNYFEFRHRLADGSVRDVEVYSTALEMDGKEVLYSIIHDVTEKRRAVESVLYEQYLLNSLMDTTPDLIYFKDNESRLIRVNKAVLNRFGFRHESEILGKTDFDLFSQEYALQTFNDERRILETGSPIIGLEEKVIWPDGHITWASTSKLPLKDAKGNIIGTFGISRDITEWKKIIEELSKAKEKAEESDRLKTSFLQNISHEVRTPMNAIMGFSELLLNENLLPGKRKEYINIICQSGTNLLNIIEDVLKISSIETGQEKVKLEECRLSELISVLELQFRRKAEQKNLDFITDYGPDEEILFLTDKTKLTQILANLLNNALKFTHKGFVRFGCRVENNFLRFFVEDSGIGIPAEHIDRIFERFYQVESYLSRDFGGTGLGLSICRAYAEMLGGSVWAESTPGKGSVFHVMIPYQHQEVNLKEQNMEKNTAPPAGSALVLLVEDDEYNYVLVREMLSKTSLTLHRVSTGEEAVEICRKDRNVRLVLMDIKLPGMDGYEATRMIRKTRTDLPIVALTAYAMPEDEEKVRLAGCSDYLSKPLSREQLFSVLQKYLG